MSKKIIPAIRHATAVDAELLARLGEQTFSETFAPDNSEEDMAAYLAAAFNRTQQAAELADPLATFLVAEIDGSPAGYAMMYEGAPPDHHGDRKPIELVRFYVSKQWHGRGVAATLMQACVDQAKQQGYRTLWLGVWEHNRRARAFYRKWQFEEFGEHVFLLGGDPQNDILMRRAVTIS